MEKSSKKETEEKAYYEKKQRILQSFLGELDFTIETDEEDLLSLIDDMIQRISIQENLTLPDRKKLRKDIFHSLRKLDILEDLLVDSDITEIMINGKNQIFTEKKGKISKWQGGFESEEKLNDIIQQIVAKCNRSVNEASPIADARLENGSRVNVVLKPVALNGPIVTIRKFSDKPMNMNDLQAIGSFPEEADMFLKELVFAGYNIFISGGTGSGKTTFLNALSGYIPKDSRIITIEDSAELQIQGIDNLVRLESRNATLEGCTEISIRDLIRSALRMRPDRIIVGEVRGEEAIDLLQAMNTGHDGSLSTGHANSAADMISRLETMVLMGMDIPILAIRQQISSALDIIIHLGRMRDKSRKVIEITEVLGVHEQQIELNKLYEFDYDKKRLIQKGELIHVTKLQAAKHENLS